MAKSTGGKPNNLRKICKWLPTGGSYVAEPSREKGSDLLFDKDLEALLVGIRIGTRVKLDIRQTRRMLVA